jgi:hypothetical protein
VTTTYQRAARARSCAAGRPGGAIALLVLACCAFSTPARGELPGAAKLHKLVEHRREIVRSALHLDAQQQAAFAPVFDAYEAEREALGRERNGIAEDFGKASLALSAEDATALLERSFRLRRQRIEVDERFRSRFEAVLPPQKVLLLFQLNFILDSVVNYDLAGMIPLAK